MEDALTRDLRASQAADHLLALAAEHRAANDLEPAATLRWDPDHRRDPRVAGGRATLWLIGTKLQHADAPRSEVFRGDW